MFNLVGKKDYVGKRNRDFNDYLEIHNDNDRSFLILCPGDDVYCDCCNELILDEEIFLNVKRNYISCNFCMNNKLKEILND